MPVASEMHRTVSTAKIALFMFLSPSCAPFATEPAVEYRPSRALLSVCVGRSGRVDCTGDDALAK